MKIIKISKGENHAKIYPLTRFQLWWRKNKRKQNKRKRGNYQENKELINEKRRLEYNRLDLEIVNKIRREKNREDNIVRERERERELTKTNKLDRGVSLSSHKKWTGDLLERVKKDNSANEIREISLELLDKMESYFDWVDKCQTNLKIFRSANKDFFVDGNISEVNKSELTLAIRGSILLLNLGISNANKLAPDKIKHLGKTLIDLKNQVNAILEVDVYDTNSNWSEKLANLVNKITTREKEIKTFFNVNDNAPLPDSWHITLTPLKEQLEELAQLQKIKENYLNLISEEEGLDLETSSRPGVVDYTKLEQLKSYVYNGERFADHFYYYCFIFA